MTIPITAADYQTRARDLLDAITLTTGHHDNGIEACAADLAGMIIDGRWTDTPSCWHPILTRRVHRINDHSDTTPAARRALVLDVGPLLLGTADRDTHWAVMVDYRAGLTPAGYVAALTSTPTRADLAGADLAGADLTGADLAGANLSRADLSRANLARANLTGARWDDQTVWPTGFTPPA